MINVLMDIPFTPQEVDRTGIRAITPEMIADAKAQGKRWKLVCSAERVGTSAISQVAPELVFPDSPFYRVDGATSIVQFKTDVLGELSITEKDPTPDCTAYGLLADFVNAVR